MGVARYQKLIMFADLQIENVALVERFSSRRNASGALHLTSTHLIFVDHENKRETWVREYK